MARPSKRPIAPPPQASVFDRALAAYRQGWMAEAEQLYAQVPPSDGRHAMALHDRGWIKHQAGDHAGALELVQQSLRLQPGIPQWTVDLAYILFSLGKMNEAIAACDRALAMEPKNANAWNIKGGAHWYLSAYIPAIECWDRVLATAPHMAEAWANRGAALRQLGQNVLALASLERALQLAPQDARAWAEHGYTLFATQQYEKALASLEKALTLNPSNQHASTLAMDGMQRIVQWRNIERRWRHEIELIRTSGSIVLGFPMLAHPHVSARELASGLHTAVSSAFSHVTPAPFERRIPSQHLRIAYLSADFRENVMPLLMAGVFEHHNRQRFEVTAVAFKPIPPSLMGQRLVNAFDRVVEAYERSDEQVAALMRELNIDIAVDLMGHTEGNRLGILARRCAPIQVNYLGYPGASGAPFMDYILGDRWVTPLDQADTFTEKIVLMPWPGYSSITTGNGSKSRRWPSNPYRTHPWANASLALSIGWLMLTPGRTTK